MFEAAFYERAKRLIGENGLHRLKEAHVIVAGLGGVGSHCVEALVRAGVGQLTLIDFDRVTESNLNRQLLATRLSIGQLKTEVMAERIHSIHPDCQYRLIPERLLAENIGEWLPQWLPADGLIDCIDQMASKTALLIEAKRLHLPVFTSMGAGRRLDPTQIKVGDIQQTTNCPLARKLRRALREAGIIEGIRTVFSTECPEAMPDNERIIGSISYMPPLFGYTLAGEMIQYLLQTSRH